MWRDTNIHLRAIHQVTGDWQRKPNSILHRIPTVLHQTQNNTIFILIKIQLTNEKMFFLHTHWLMLMVMLMLVLAVHTASAVFSAHYFNSTNRFSCVILRGAREAAGPNTCHILFSFSFSFSLRFILYVSLARDIFSHYFFFLLLFCIILRYTYKHKHMYCVRMMGPYVRFVSIHTYILHQPWSKRT